MIVSDVHMGQKSTLIERVRSIMAACRHLLGEDLSALTVSELLKLEQQLELGASRVRARRSVLQVVTHDPQCNPRIVSKLAKRKKTEGLTPTQIERQSRPLTLCSPARIQGIATS